MATYEITMPDGGKYEVSGPEGMTDQQVYAAVTSNAGTQEKKPASNALLGAARSYTEGATLGWGDDLGLAAAAVAAKLSGVDDKSYGDIYDSMQQRYQAEQGQFREENPGLSLGAELLGGVATGGTIARGLGKFAAGPLATYAPRAANLASRAPRAIAYPASGAAAGAIGGAGFAGPESRGEGAAVGALFGGGIGAGAAIGGSVASAIASRLPRNQASRAERTIARELERSGVTPEIANKRLDRLGERGMIADIIPDLAETVAQVPGAARTRATQALVGRELRQPGNLRKAARSAVGETANYVDEIERLAQKRAADAGPLYRSALAMPLNVTRELASIFKRPSMQTALKKAESMAREEGGVIAGNVNRVNYAKLALDDMISEARRAGQGNRVRQLTQTKNDMLRIVDDQVPDYAAARKAWEEPSRAMDVIELGRNIFKKNADEIAAEVKGLDPADLDYYRTGLYRELLDMVDNFGGNRDPRFLLMKPAIRDKVRAAFAGDTGAFRTFQRLIKNESTKKRTRNQALGNSATARRNAQQADAAIDPNLAVDLAVGNYAQAAQSGVRQAVNALRGKGMPEKEAEKVARMIFNSNPEQRRAILERIGMPNLLIPPKTPGPASLGTSVIGGEFAGGLLRGN